jgi:pimeloyl-ACP methyl ester carboxylesterase
MKTNKTRRFSLPRILRIAFKTLFGLLALSVLLSAIAADRLTVAKRSFTPDTPLTYGMRYEDVIFPAREDGLKIAAWYIPVEGQAAANTPAIVMVHGWTASRTIGYNQHFLNMAKALHEAGFAVMMIDLRGHGQSEAAHVSFGVYERRDVLAAIDDLLARGHQPGKIGLLGTSMGAASVIGAAAENPAVGAVVTDSLFAEVYPVIEGQWVAVSGIPTIYLHTTLTMFELMHGYDLATARPVEEIKQVAPRPLLMIHCQADAQIPIDHFQRLQAAAPWAETWLVDECRHAEIYEFVPQEYDQKVVGFFKAGLLQEEMVYPALDVRVPALTSKFSIQ